MKRVSGLPIYLLLFFLCMPVTQCKRTSRRHVEAPDKTHWISDPDYWDQFQNDECEGHDKVEKEAETLLENTLKPMIFHVYYGVLAAELTIRIAEVSSSLKGGSSPASSVIPSSVCDIFKLTNVVVCILWARAEAKKNENPDFLRAMENHFVAPLGRDDRRKRPHSLLLSAFSHPNVDQLIRTFMVLLVLGEQLEPTMGSRKFVYLYIYAIYASQFLQFSYVSKIHSKAKTKATGGSIGASMAIRILLAYYCLRRPKWILSREDVDVVVLIWFISELFPAIVPSGKCPQRLDDSSLGLGSYAFGSIFWLAERLLFGSYAFGSIFWLAERLLFGTDKPQLSPE